MASKKIQLSCVVPAYNESKTIEKHLKIIDDYWKKHVDSHEIIVVDDGSSDNTVSVVKRLVRQRKNIVLLPKEQNGGKGTAVKWGMSKTRGAVVYFIDADLPFTMNDQKKVVSKVLDGETKVSLGSRVVRKKIDNNSLMRKIASGTLSTINRLLLGIAVKDTQCGLKAFDGPLARRVFRKLDTAGFAWDLEVLYRISKEKEKMVTVPVKLQPEVRPSTVHVFSSGIEMLRDIFRIRFSSN